MHRIHHAALLGLLLTTSCTIPTTRFGSETGEDVNLTAIVEDAAKRDVVFFGEVHTSDECHEQQRLFLVELYRKRPQLAISMEMFERDVQEHLDAYMAGKMTEEEFKKKARAWPNWHHYRPLVQFAAMTGIPVIAANAPVKLVRKVSREGGGGLEAVLGNPLVAREVETPKDAYYDAFVVEMAKGEGQPADAATSPQAWVQRFYEAQCVRDETMAESIADYLDNERQKGRDPLVVHFCGNFHSAFRRGTVERLERRKPKLDIMVISTTEAGELDAERAAESGDFFLAVPKVKKRNKNVAQHPTPKKNPHAHGDPHKKADPHAQGDPHKKADPHGAHPKSKSGTAKAKTKAEAEEPDPHARPGLGFMPAYESDVPGCGVDQVMEGSAAEKAGIKSGDVIVKFAGEEVDDVRSYSSLLSGLRVGQKVEVVVQRKGKEVKLQATLGESGR